VVNDPRYGHRREKRLPENRFFLHSTTLSFGHPRTDENGSRRTVPVGRPDLRVLVPESVEFLGDFARGHDGRVLAKHVSASSSARRTRRTTDVHLRGRGLEGEGSGPIQSEAQAQYLALQAFSFSRARRGVGRPSCLLDVTRPPVVLARGHEVAQRGRVSLRTRADRGSPSRRRGRARLSRTALVIPVASVNSSSVGLRPKIDVSFSGGRFEFAGAARDFEGDAESCEPADLDGALQSLTDPPGGVRWRI